MKTFECATDVYDTLREIKESYKDRVVFYIIEMNRLNMMLDTKHINESYYYRRLCHLLAEKRNINKQYKHEFMNILQYVPATIYMDNFMPYFEEDLL
jgi:hypothetical protein